MRLSLLQKVENAHEDSVWTVAWAAGSNRLITGSVDETVKIWQEQEDTLKEAYKFHDVSLGAVSVAVDATGSYGAVCSLDSAVSVWDMTTLQRAFQLDQPPSEAWGIAFMPRSSATDPVVLALAGGSSNRVRVWNASAGKEVIAADMPANQDKLQRRERFVLSVAVSPDGRRIAAGAMDGAVAVFDSSTGQLVHRLDGHFKPVRGLTFTPDGKHLLTACDDMHVGMYDVEGGALVDSFSGHESWAVTVAAHPDGSACVTGGADGKVKLWDLGTRTCVQTLSDHSDQVWGVAWRGDGSRVASVSDDRSVCLFDFA